MANGHGHGHGTNREYDLIVRQEPKQARMCGVGTKGRVPTALPCRFTPESFSARLFLHCGCVLTHAWDASHSESFILTQPLFLHMILLPLIGRANK